MLQLMVPFCRLGNGGDLPTAADMTKTLIDTIKEQRNNLSKELNLLRQRLGRLDCEVNLL